MSDEENNNNNAENPLAAAEPATTDEPSAPTFTQEQLQAIVAKEVAKAKRAAKRAPAPTPQQETPAGVGPNEEILATIATIAERVEALHVTNAARSVSDDFAEHTKGLALGESESMLRTLHEHNLPAFTKHVDGLRAADAPPAPKGTAPPLGIPAPAATPSGENLGAPATWGHDQVQRMRANGTFLQALADYRATLPGSGGGLFAGKKGLNKPGK